MLSFIFLIIHKDIYADQGNNITVFPDIAGMYKTGLPNTYIPENLYEYINGAAESYLAYGFQELFVQIYENDQKQSGRSARHWPR